MVFLTLILTISLGILSYNSIRSDYESRFLINILGKQRVLSQVMAKDAMTLYTLRNALLTSPALESSELANREIADLKNKLISSEREFDAVFLSIKKGEIYRDDETIYFKDCLDSLAPILGETDQLWINFKHGIEVLRSDTGNNDDITNAILYISNNNDKLLENSDKITNIVVESSRGNSKYSIVISSSLALAALIALVLLLFNIYKYMLLPLDELYSGLSQVGVTRSDLKINQDITKELTPIISEVNEMFGKVNNLINIIENLNQNKSFDEMLRYIYSSFSPFVPYTHIGIALMENEGKVVKAAYGISGETVNELFRELCSVKANVSETTLGKIIETGKPRIINDLEEYVKGKPFKDYNKIILGNGIKSSITLPLKINNEPVGIIFFSSRYKNVYKTEHIKFLRALTNGIAISLQTNLFVGEILYSSILALAKLAESRDNETGEHLNRMKVYSRVITQLLFTYSKYKADITPEYINDIERFSPLHDIGKVAIRDEVLLKPGKLTLEEFEVMKTHAEFGSKVLEAAENNVLKTGRSIFKMGIEIAGGHHEKWDGSGYPYKKVGEEIPLSARIVAVADVFDALTSKRPYKEAFSIDKAYSIIEEGKGKHFDPEIIDIFIQHKDKIVETFNELHGTENTIVK
jgi:HD-GYP domain-containing protein (c-di-GMP phosphodiesterase class II)